MTIWISRNFNIKIKTWKEEINTAERWWVICLSTVYLENTCILWFSKCIYYIFFPEYLQPLRAYSTNPLSGYLLITQSMISCLLGGLFLSFFFLKILLIRLYVCLLKPISLAYCFRTSVTPVFLILLVCLFPCMVRLDI